MPAGRAASRAPYPLTMPPSERCADWRWAENHGCSPARIAGPRARPSCSRSSDREAQRRRSPGLARRRSFQDRRDAADPARRTPTLELDVRPPLARRRVTAALGGGLRCVYLECCGRARDRGPSQMRPSGRASRYNSSTKYWIERRNSNLQLRRSQGSSLPTRRLNLLSF